MGDPKVYPWRTPPRNSTSSFSIFWRPPRPYPCCLRTRSRSISFARSPKPAGTPCTRVTSAGPCDSPAVEKPNLTALEYVLSRSTFEQATRSLGYAPANINHPPGSVILLPVPPKRRQFSTTAEKISTILLAAPKIRVARRRLVRPCYPYCHHPRCLHP